MTAVQTSLLGLLLGLASTPATSYALAVSGHVTAAGSGAPLAGASVAAYETFPDPWFSISTTTDASGYYQVDVPQGLPHLTAAFPGRVPQTLTPAPGSDPATLDFSLTLAASIAGTIRDASTLEALAGKTVTLRYANAVAIASTTVTDSNGTFTFSTLPAGDYAACVADPTDAYLDSCYDDVPLAADGTQSFTTISVSAGEDLQGADFNLTSGATLSGTLRDGFDSSVLVDTKISATVYSAQKQLLFTTSIVTDDSGLYAVHGLPAGSYYVSVGEAFNGTATNSLYLSRFFGCSGVACTLNDAMPVNVPEEGASNVDISPFPGSVVIGKVTDAATNVGIAGVTVASCEYYFLFFAGPTGSAVTDANGNYVLKHLIAKADSNPHVSTIDAVGYQNEMWQDTPVLPAAFCSGQAGGSTITGFTTPEQPVQSIDFALQKGASISGTLDADEFPGTALPGLVSLFQDDGQSRHLVSTVTTDASGHYKTVGVAAGTYYLVAYFESGVAGCTLYGDAPCDGPGALDDPYSIDFASGTPVVLDALEAKTGIDIHLPVRIFAGNFQ